MPLTNNPTPWSAVRNSEVNSEGATVLTQANRLTVYLDAVGLFAPGMPNWQVAQTLLRTAELPDLTPLPIPAPTVLPSAERRRVGTGVKLALAVGLDALRSMCSAEQTDVDADNTLAIGAHFQTVFTSSGGDGDNCHALCEALAQPDRAISPTRFTNSVHNAPSGYWGIALRAKPASTSICAFDGSFGAGFLDAVTQVVTQQTAVLLISYDTPYPEPLKTVRPIQTSVGVALLLSPKCSQHSVAQMSVRLDDATPDIMPVDGLETLRKDNPTARVLPLLARLAQHSAHNNQLGAFDPAAPNLTVDSAGGVEHVKQVVLEYLPACAIVLDCKF